MFRLVAKRREVSYQRVDQLVLPDTFRLTDGASWTPCTGAGRAARRSRA